MLPGREHPAKRLSASAKRGGIISLLSRCDGYFPDVVWHNIG
ncbi:hypothetical protein EPYR_01670 [Erwinia pyrifoliae DSM 12163]|nr:hypothetical protein EJP617_31490 [Erwinia sp. Ejp617]CAY74050.1 hypothetical protein EPYR_01670 [Erwinia pyrifoliae DSM 12163]